MLNTLTRTQQIGIGALAAMSVCLIVLLFTRGGTSKASLSGNTLNFTCGNSSLKGSHYLKLGIQTTLQGRVVSVERKPYMKSCGLEYALLKWVSEETYRNCLKSFVSIGQCERESQRSSGSARAPGFNNHVLMLIPTSTNNKFWKAGFIESSPISLKVWEVTSIDKTDFLGGGGGFTVSEDPHYWVESIQ